jgi:hypothetical protein
MINPRSIVGSKRQASIRRHRFYENVPRRWRHGFAHARTRTRAVSLRRRRLAVMVVKDPCMRGHIKATRKGVNFRGEAPVNFS